MKILLIRHGMTQWNSEKRIQGQIDQPLSSQGIEQINAYRLSPELLGLNWFCSPLQRSHHSAQLMGINDPILVPELTEMNWGDWEGQILKPLRKQLGDEMRSNEARGLDFQPPNGESPRHVQHRLMRWLTSLNGLDGDIGAVVHKGIIRCFYSLASGWDMRGESPVEFDWQAGHLFEITEDGRVEDYYQAVDLIPAQ